MLSFVNWSDDRIEFALLHMDSYFHPMHERSADDVFDLYLSFRPRLGENLSRESNYGCIGGAVWEQGFHVAAMNQDDSPGRYPITDKRWGMYGAERASVAGIWTIDRTYYENQGHHINASGICDARYIGLSPSLPSTNPEVDPRNICPTVSDEFWNKGSSIAFKACVLPVWDITFKQLLLDGPQREEGKQLLELLLFVPGRHTGSDDGYYVICPPALDDHCPLTLVKLDQSGLEHRHFVQAPNGNIGWIPTPPANCSQKDRFRDDLTGNVHPYLPVHIDTVHMHVPHYCNIPSSVANPGEDPGGALLGAVRGPHEGRYVQVYTKGLCGRFRMFD